MSNKDRITALYLALFDYLNGQLLQDTQLGNLLKEGIALYTGDVTEAVYLRFRKKMERILQTAENETVQPVFVYAFIDSVCQEMLEVVRNRPRRMFWEKLYRHVSLHPEMQQNHPEIFERPQMFFEMAEVIVGK